MPKWINSAREFLGLGDDPYYDDYDEDYEDLDAEEESEPVVEPRSAPRARRAEPAPARRAAPEPEWEDDRGVRMLTASEEPSPASSTTRTERGMVRPLPTSSKPRVVSPTRFDDVQEVADGFKRVQPVIVNLQGVDRDLSRRLIDFASGLCYGLEGEMERVAEQVFLLTPKGAEVSADDRRRLEEGRVSEYDD